MQSRLDDVAQETDFGEEESNDLFDLRNSRTIVLWGKNPYVSSVHLLPVLREAKARGTRLIQIDPVHHRGAAALPYGKEGRQNAHCLAGEPGAYYRCL